MPISQTARLEAPIALPPDSSNRFTVARDKTGVFVMSPFGPGRRMTDDEAVNLAAWLTVMVDHGDERVAKMIRAITA